MREFRSTPESPGGPPPDSLQRPHVQDTLRHAGVADTTRRPIGPDTLSRHITAPPVHQPLPDTLSHRVAAPLIDTTAHAAAPADTAKLDSTHQAHPPIGQAQADTTKVPAGPDAAGTIRTQLLAKERELQLAYLHVAEFYAYSLTEQDSALTYYRLAAASPVNADVFWRANLYLASAIPVKSDSATADSLKSDSLSTAAIQYYRAVAAADSVPIQAKNAALAALKMPLIEVPVSEQVTALHTAEAAQKADSVSVETVIDLYSRVIAMDSTSTEGKKALFAKATLLESKLHKYDQARLVYQGLLRVGADSTMAQIAHGKVAPPDSGSIFFLSDDQLSGKHESVESLFDQKKDESGWPPEEATLRGRHFR